MSAGEVMELEKDAAWEEMKRRVLASVMASGRVRDFTGEVRDVAAAEGYLRERGYDELVPDNWGRMAAAMATMKGPVIIGGARHKGLFLKGETGVGKSLSAEVLAGYLGGFEGVMPGSAAIKARWFVEQWEGGGAGRRVMWEVAGTRAHLLIDDLGWERQVNGGEIMEEVIDRRHAIWERCGALTVITSNLAFGEIGTRRYDQRTASRLRHMMNALTLIGPDRRDWKQVELWRRKQAQKARGR